MSYVRTITLPVYRCLRCGHEWWPARDPKRLPKRCPQCKSYVWQSPRPEPKYRQTKRPPASEPEPA